MGAAVLAVGGVVFVLLTVRLPFDAGPPHWPWETRPRTTTEGTALSLPDYGIYVSNFSARPAVLSLTVTSPDDGPHRFEVRLESQGGQWVSDRFVHINSRLRLRAVGTRENGKKWLYRADYTIGGSSEMPSLLWVVLAPHGGDGEVWVQRLGPVFHTRSGWARHWEQLGPPESGIHIENATAPPQVLRRVELLIAGVGGAWVCEDLAPGEIWFVATKPYRLNWVEATVRLEYADGTRDHLNPNDEGQSMNLEIKDPRAKPLAEVRTRRPQ